MKKAKKHMIIVLVIVGLIVVAARFQTPAEHEYNDAPYLDITYSAKNEHACLTFYKNGKYTMYDCDSEPTSYFFDDENECKYNYVPEENKVYFICENSVWNINSGSIKIFKWTDKEIVFDYKGETKKFYKEVK